MRPTDIQEMPLAGCHVYLDGCAALELFPEDVASIIAEVCAIWFASLLPHDVGLDTDLEQEKAGF